MEPLGVKNVPDQDDAETQGLKDPAIEACQGFPDKGPQIPKCGVSMASVSGIVIMVWGVRISSLGTWTLQASTPLKSCIFNADAGTLHKFQGGPSTQCSQIVSL